MAWIVEANRTIISRNDDCGTGAPIMDAIGAPEIGAVAAGLPKSAA